MNRLKFWKRIVSFILCVALFSSGLQVHAELTNDLIKQKEKEVKSAQDEVKSLKAGLTDVKAIKAQLQAAKNDLDAYITELDANLAELQAKIEELKQMITNKEHEIEVKTEELHEAEDTQAAQYAAMKDRIKFMYERGDTLYMELLLETGTFSDMINKLDYIEMLSSYDRQKLDEYMETTAYVGACKEALEAEKVVLDEAEAAVELEEAGVEELLEEKTSEINAVSADIANKEAAIKEYEKQIAAENAEIAALEAAIAAERQRLEEEQRRKYNGGVFAWPCPGYKRISSDYGYRRHPILGVEKFHSGVDMAAPAGTPILAAYDGDVVAAAYSSSMGNYVMIDHGSGIYTIYMHASALYVSKGQTVSKGQKIAGVGTTGQSTGNHLHFSVRVNGNYVSPWQYISK